MKRPALIWLAAIAASSSACFLSPYSLLTSDDSNSDDGASDARDAAPKPPVHAAVDAGDGGCTWFCEGFDRDPWPGAGWGNPTIYGGGTIDVTSARSLSPPRSVRSSLPANGGSGSAAVLQRPYAGAFTAIHCEVSVQIESASEEEASLLVLHARAASRDYVIGVRAASDTTTLVADNVVEHGLPALPLRTWTRVGIDLKIGATPKLTYDGTPRNDAAKYAAVNAGAPAFDSATLLVGAQRTLGVGGVWTVAYDDVACELR